MPTAAIFGLLVIILGASPGHGCNVIETASGNGVNIFPYYCEQAFTALGRSAELTSNTTALTFLLPSDEATLEFLLAWANATEHVNTSSGIGRMVLDAIIEYHVLPAALTEVQINQKPKLETLFANETIGVAPTEDTTVLSSYGTDASIIRADISSCASMLQVIDNVLVPDLEFLERDRRAGSL